MTSTSLLFLGVLLQKIQNYPIPPAPPERSVLELKLISGFFILLSLLLDYYVFGAIKAAFGKLSLVKKRPIYFGYAILSLVTFGLLTTLVIIKPEEVPRSLRWIVTAWVSVWVPAKLIVAFFMGVDDLIRLARWVKSWFIPVKVGVGGETITRSEFIAQAALISAAVPALATSYGIWKGAYAYRVENIDVPIKGLPKGFDGFRILQFSDTHTGSFADHEAVAKGIEMANAQNPDIICFTGDLVNNVASEMDGYLDLFDKLKCKGKIYSILGNHDYGTYASWIPVKERPNVVKEIIAVHKQLGWDILLNENRLLDFNGAQINLIGVENRGTGRFPRKGDIYKAKQGSVTGLVNILMSHDPSHWDAEVRPLHPDIQLTMSGHTHGMQFGIEIPGFKWSPVQYRYKQWGGLYTEADQHLYVNRGFGFIGFPGRVGMPPEITVMTLRVG